MEPRPHIRKKRHTSKVMLLVSLTVHGLIILGLVFLAAREGFLGKELKKIAVEMVKEKQPEKPKDPEKPKERPKIEPPKMAVAPKVEAPVAPATASAPPPAQTDGAAPLVAPPTFGDNGFVFAGGKTVASSDDPVELYRLTVEATLRSQWNRPTDIADDNFVAEVELEVDAKGKVLSNRWKKGSGNNVWDQSVRRVVESTRALSRPPPTNFPPRFLVRFDVQEVTEPLGTTP